MAGLRLTIHTELAIVSERNVGCDDFSFCVLAGFSVRLNWRLIYSDAFAPAAN